jgi:HEAT repeat protein
MVSLLRAAANYRSPAIADAILARLQTTLGPVSLNAAYIALGKQRDRAPLETLTAAAERPTRDGRAQAGAFLGLGESRQEQVTDALLTYATYGGSPNRARPSAARALAVIGKNLEPSSRAPITEKLIDLLRDPWYSVAWAAARALGELGESSAIPALETSAQQKQVDDLRDKVRTLEQQLQTLTARLEAEKVDEE